MGGFQNDQNAWVNNRDFNQKTILAFSRSGPQCVLPSINNGKIQIVSQANEANENSSSVDIDTQIEVVCYGNATLTGNPLATCMEDGIQ